MEDKLSKEQVKTLIQYFDELNRLKGLEPEEEYFPQETLEVFTPIYNLIQQLGNGDPLIAAARHAEVMSERAKNN